MYVLGNPLKYVDPTGHKQVCADGDEGGGCGYGANTEQIFKTFNKEHGGRYGGLFAEYYAKLHAANKAISTGDPNADAYVASAEQAKQYALTYVPQQGFDPSQVIDPNTVYQFANTLISIGKDLAGVTSWAFIIKPGATGGSSAGKLFSDKIKERAYQEDPTTTCVYCGRVGSGTQVDHAIPRARGGNAEIANAQLACPHCNASKGKRNFPLTPPPEYEGIWPPPWWP
jgi:filamentous hemagglutinin